MQTLQNQWKSKNKKTKLIIILVVFLMLCIVCGIFGAHLPSGDQNTETNALYTQAAQTAVRQATIETAPAYSPTNTPMPTPTTDLIEYYINRYGGEQEVYAEIISLEDCTELQNKFDTAYSNNQREKPGTALYSITLGYMSAADDRMRAIGCYDDK